MKITTLDGKTPDIAEENIQKLKQLFPEVFTEGKVDFEKLKQVLGEYVEDSNERYNFSWNGKGRALRISQTPSLGTLRPCKEESKDWDTTQNLYIEGDNLEVLKLLQKSYYGKVKMIYIDPPYNTGKDFVYKDDFHDSLENYRRITGQVDGNGKAISTNPETSGRYHTDWLNMMYPRLRLARNLLADDGVIFISIDDNELFNLKKICDEIFGEDNYVTEFAWEKKKKPSFLHRNVGKLNDYILCYVKNALTSKAFSVETTTEGKKYPFNNAGNGLTTLTFPAGSVKFNMPDGVVQPQDMSEGAIITRLLDTVHISNGRNSNSFRLEGEWRYSQTKLNEIVANSEEIIISKIPFRPNHVKKGGEVKKMKNVLSPVHYQMETNEDATQQLVDLFGVALFDNPKPVKLLKYLIRAVTYDTSDAVILDFFSGSATTAHAVMQLNAEDGGNRKFIMVQLPEPTDEKSEAHKADYINICEIGKERIRRAGEKIKEENKDKENIESLDIGFKVFKLDTSNIRKWQPDYDNLEQSLLDYIDNFIEGRTELDVVYEIMLKYGLDLTYPVDEFTIAQKKVYSIGFGMLMICLDDEITTEVAKGILAKIKELSPESSRVVFKDNGFKTDSNKTNIKEILKSGGIEEFITI